VQNRRSPIQSDLDALGTGVKPARRTKIDDGTSTTSEDRQSSPASNRGLAAALRLGLREG
ncbi:MAG: hypothetical protein MJE12_31050, partial [Alphaproteobacteria bacterium]|nr:hypothetical protein [Alphaproteobacteria bacterium]